MGDSSQHTYEFGEFRLVPAERTLLRADEPVRLTPKEFDLLLLLVEQGGRLVEKARLMDMVWPGTTVEEANLTQTVFTLRRALGPEAASFIETVPKRGYRFTAEVRARREGERAFRQLTFRRGPVHAARFTHDPASVVHDARWEGDRVSLHTLSLWSLEARQLGPAGAGLLAASRATGELALLLGRRLLRGYVSTGTLALTDPFGASARELLEGAQWADFSPDGSRLAVVSERGGRCRLEYPAGQVVYESDGWVSHPRVSPDGREVAFIDHPLLDDDSGSICVVTAEGRRSVLSDGWISAYGLAWSPDGREVWFTATRRGNARALHAVTREGRLRLLERVAGSLTLHDAAAHARALVTRDSTRLSITFVGPGEGRGRDLSWRDWSLARDLSADGRRLLFTEAGEASGETYSVYLRGTDGSPAVRLGEGSALALSTDGRWALARAHGPDQHLVLLPTGAGEPRRLEAAGLNYQPWACFVPNGEHVLFAAAEAGRGTRLYVQALAGGPARLLRSTPEGVQLTTPHAVSPDGREVAAVGPRGDLCLYPLEGHRPRGVRGAEPDDLPVRWDEGGRHLYVRRRGELPVRVYRVAVGGGGARQLVRELMPADPTGVSEVLRVLLTPGAEHCAYTYTRELSDLYLVEGLS